MKSIDRWSTWVKFARPLILTSPWPDDIFCTWLSRSREAECEERIRIFASIRRDYTYIGSSDDIICLMWFWEAQVHESEVIIIVAKFFPRVWDNSSTFSIFVEEYILEFFLIIGSSCEDGSSPLESEWEGSGLLSRIEELTIDQRKRRSRQSSEFFFRGELREERLSCISIEVVEVKKWNNPSTTSERYFLNEYAMRSIFIDDNTGSFVDHRIDFCRSIFESFCRNSSDSFFLDSCIESHRRYSWWSHARNTDHPCFYSGEEQYTEEETDEAECENFSGHIKHCTYFFFLVKLSLQFLYFLYNPFCPSNNSRFLFFTRK